MSGSTRRPGRHKLGTAGLRHCVYYTGVADALAEYRRTWLTAILTPARHTLAGLRRRAAQAAVERAWAPIPVTT